MTDEDIIKRKLIMDSDGTGDDRRLNLLLKLINRLNKPNTTNDEMKLIHYRILTLISQCNYSRLKSEIIKNMNSKEIQNYINRHHNMEEKCDETRKMIKYVKDSFRIAKSVKQSKIKFNMLTKDILQYPDQKTSKELIKNIKSEMETLQHQKDMLSNKYENVQKQVYVLVTSSNQIMKEVQDIKENNVI